MQNKIMPFFIFSFLLCLLIYFNKNKETIRIEQKEVHDTIKMLDTVITKQIVTRKKFILKLDTLYKILEVPRKIIVKDSAKCDSLYSLCLEQKKVIILDDSIINNQSKQVSKYKELVTIKNKTIDSLSTNKKYHKGLLHGFALGFTLGFIVK